MKKAELDALAFSYKSLKIRNFDYAKAWHAFEKGESIKEVMEGLKSKGLIDVNNFRQFCITKEGVNLLRNKYPQFAIEYIRECDSCGQAFDHNDLISTGGTEILCEECYTYERGDM